MGNIKEVSGWSFALAGNPGLHQGHKIAPLKPGQNFENAIKKHSNFIR